MAVKRKSSSMLDSRLVATTPNRSFAVGMWLVSSHHASLRMSTESRSGSLVALDEDSGGCMIFFSRALPQLY